MWAHPSKPFNNNNKTSKPNNNNHTNKILIKNLTDQGVNLASNKIRHNNLASKTQEHSDNNLIKIINSGRASNKIIKSSETRSKIISKINNGLNLTKKYLIRILISLVDQCKKLQFQ